MTQYYILYFYNGSIVVWVVKCQTSRSSPFDRLLKQAVQINESHNRHAVQLQLNNQNYIELPEREWETSLLLA